MTADDQPIAEAPLAFAITGGGAVTAEQLAALTVALTPSGGNRDESTRSPAWARAARFEAIGHRPFWSAPDIDGGRFALKG